jgi:toxin CcdB
MARFDVFRLAGGLVVDVQTNLLSDLETRLVMPLLPVGNAPIPATRLNPVVEFQGSRYALQPQFMSAIARRHLPKPLGSLDKDYDRVVASIDMIFNGF